MQFFFFSGRCSNFNECPNFVETILSETMDFRLGLLLWSAGLSIMRVVAFYKLFFISVEHVLFLISKATFSLA